jgi:dTDP-4-dehydrorhamnose 3,5-epimerase
MSGMTIQSIRMHDGDIAGAYAAASRIGEPLFVPAPVYADDRGWSIMNQFQGVLSPEGQINYAVLYPGAIKAWHRHRDQTDFWFCVQGHIKVGVFREASDNGARPAATAVVGDAWSIVLGEKRPGIVIIPPTLWHGVATVSHEQAAMFYYVTRAFNAATPDEDRRAFDSVPGFPWSIQHR